jgi:hypothetical protein
MSDLAEKLRNAVLCVEPSETYDQQLQRVTNCSAHGSTVVSNHTEPQIYQAVPKDKQQIPGTVDAEAINPGEQVLSNDGKSAVPAASTTESGGGIGEWVKKNPIVAAGGAALLLYLISRK